MAKIILLELEMRIRQLQQEGKEKFTSEEQKRCLESRISELEAMKEMITERIGKSNVSEMNNHDYWQLVDEF